MKILVLVHVCNTLLLKCLFPGVCPNVRSLRNNRRQPCSGNIYDKNVSLCFSSSLCVFCFIFNVYIKSDFYFVVKLASLLEKCLP